MVDKRDLKWRELRMKCLISGCPQINQGDTLYVAVQKACSQNEKTPVVVNFQKGFAIPEGVKFYDAFFMALEQTSEVSPRARLQEAAMIKEVVPDFKFDKEMEITLAFYRNEILRDDPSQVEGFSEQELADTYKILSKMKVAENKVGLPYVENALSQRNPQLLKDLKASAVIHNDKSSRDL